MTGSNAGDEAVLPRRRWPSRSRTPGQPRPKKSRRGFDFTAVTEDWDTPASRTQREAVHLRYRLAADVSENGVLIEAACGTGFGLAMTRLRTRISVGGDLMMENLVAGKSRDSGLVLIQHDAEALPYRAGCADTVACLEALYYLQRPERFLEECKRVLRPNGRVLVVVPNPFRPGFSPSPGSRRYFGAQELLLLFASAGFVAEVWGAFPSATDSRRERMIERARRSAVHLHLLPRTTRMRGLIKRYILRDAAPLSDLTTPIDPAAALSPIGEDGVVNGRWIVLYAIGRRP